VKKIVDNFGKFSFTDSPKGSTDEVHNYACNLLSIGLFFLAYRDAIEEGDSERVLDSWHYFFITVEEQTMQMKHLSYYANTINTPASRTNVV